jgi:putative transcriptional regulator
MTNCVLNRRRFGAIIFADIGARGAVIVLSFVLRRWFLIAVAIVMPATLLHAALPTETELPNRFWLNGQILIASPQLRQPAFHHAVVLLVRHNRDGAFGVVINRPTGKRSVARMLKELGADASGVNGTVPVFSGGPVEPDVALVIHSIDYRAPDTLDIDGRVALSAAADVLRDMAVGKGPNKSLIVFGYVGWEASQLEDELAHGVWVTVPEDPALVFDDDRSKLWADALVRQKSIR